MLLHLEAKPATSQAKLAKEILEALKVGDLHLDHHLLGSRISMLSHPWSTLHPYMFMPTFCGAKDWRFALPLLEKMEQRCVEVRCCQCSPWNDLIWLKSSPGWFVYLNGFESQLKSDIQDHFRMHTTAYSLCPGTLLFQIPVTIHLGLESKGHLPSKYDCHCSNAESTLCPDLHLQVTSPRHWTNHVGIWKSTNLDAWIDVPACPVFPWF